MRVLNLGAGNRILSGDGVINHDVIAHRPEITNVWDLNVTPWLWGIDEFDAIEFISVIEHLKITPIDALNECWRILKRGGVLTVKYPLYTAETVHDDPTHRWFLSEKSFDYVIPGTRYEAEYPFYSPYKWELIERGVIKARNVKAKMRPIKD